MLFAQTTATQKIQNLSKKIRAVQGGTSASKTISILLYLIAMCQTDTNKTVTSVVSESLPHLKKGAIRDFKNIMQGHGYWKDSAWNKTDSTYAFETGSIIEFFGADSGDKLRGARRDRCFMNEANNMTLDAFDQLEVRTKEFMFLDWNPTTEFWFYTDVLNKRDDIDFITLTYKDNEALSQEIVSSIESRKNRKGWWQVYGLGQLGEVEGKIYRDWKVIDELPHSAKYLRSGLDFGYTNDPSVMVDIYQYDGGYIIDEVFYQKGLLNSQIASIINSSEDFKRLVVADAAEPKSIDEIKLHGCNVLPSHKGQGAVMHRINAVQAQKISITKRSVNTIKEYRNYLFVTDKDGKILNEPEHEYSHSMDAVGYGLESIVKTEQESFVQDAVQAQFNRNQSRLTNTSTR